MTRQRLAHNFLRRWYRTCAAGARVKHEHQLAVRELRPTEEAGNALRNPRIDVCSLPRHRATERL